MVTYTPHYLLQMIGTNGSANPEIWSCGIRLWSASFSGFDEVGYLNGLAKDACAAWVTRATSKINTVCSLDVLKFNFINATGHYEDPGNTLQYVYPTPPSGGGGTSTNPYQAAVVLTWRTKDVARGRGSRGRIYSPAPTVGTSATTGLFASAEALGMAQSAQTLLNTLDVGFGEPVTGGIIRPQIMSSVDGSHHQIDWVDVDNRVDVQRRRANQLVPAKSTVEVLY